MIRQLVCLGILFSLMNPRAAAADDLGLKVAQGFQVTLYADENVANDIYAMTLDSQGRVVVTSEGWIKVLHEATSGRVDRATLFAETKTGGMGLCFDGDDLYFCGDNWLSRYPGTRAGKAAGPAEHLVPLRYTEHGGHAMRKGPDGCWYVIGGNSTDIDRRHVQTSNSPVRAPESGALLRLTPDGKQCEVIAHGFRNPYDFDFNAAGDLFTYDSDVERDFFLPWYSPTRMYHIAPGGHHGWRLPGFMRSWCRKDHYLDTIDILWPVGRGSPTGVACYRHDQFPAHYRGGLFALDWTFGKVFFFPLSEDGSTYRTKGEVFLESTGTHGFAPTDVVVTPDGALLISIGGRRTRGAIYRIAYVGDGKAALRRPASSDLEAVLSAPQPLDAWSRARWMPVARKLGASAFLTAVVDDKLDVAARIRAVEVLTELFGGVPTETAAKAAKTSAAPVRARLAWSLGRVPSPGFAELLYILAEDRDTKVRNAALMALCERSADLDGERLRALLPSSFAHADKRVRQSAARLATLLPNASWQKLWAEQGQGGTQAARTAALAALWRDVKMHAAGSIDIALTALAQRDGGPLQHEAHLQALRLIMMAFGDYHLQNPPIETHTAYSVAQPLQGREISVARILQAVRPLFPADDERLNIESSRVLAMFEDDDPATVRKVAERWTKTSGPTDDTHYLVVMSRLRGPRDAKLTPRIAAALLSLDRKLRGQEQRNKQNWGQRLKELAAALESHDPRLPDTLLKHPDLVHPAHVAIVDGLGDAFRRQAARRFLEAAKKERDFAWSGELVNLLALLPAAEVRPVFRDQWEDFGMRDALLIQLLREPEAVDRDKFLFGLESGQPQLVANCLDALAKLPRDESPEKVVPLLRLLRGLAQEPKQAKQRARVLALIERQTGQSFHLQEDKTDPVSLRLAYRPAFDWFEKQHPKLTALLNQADAEDPAAWSKFLADVDWTKGDAPRGEVLFRTRGCVTCHSGPSRLGPDLAGVSSRFSRDDLMAAIIYPSREVAPPYRVTQIETRAGQSYSGIVAFFSADGVILQTGATTTVRLAAEDIAVQRATQRSLMPAGLLKDLKPGEVADLYRFLQTLTPGSKRVLR